MMTELHRESYETLCNDYNDLKSDGDRPQGRGYELEKLLYRLFKREDLDPRPSFRNKGEQIDGSLALGLTTILLEAKWYKTPLPASVLYEFKGKVDGKFIGT